MTLHEDRHTAEFLLDGESAAQSGESTAPALVLSGASAISGAVMGFLLAGDFYACAGSLVSALLSGSYGLRNKNTQAVACGIAVQISGIDMQQCEDVSHQQARLSFLRSELVVLYDDQACPYDLLPFVLDIDGETPKLLIGESAVVTINNKAGHFVFTELAPHTGVIVITASEGRLIDHVVYHLTASESMSGEETTNKAARLPVGETLAEVERRVILQTLRYYNSNRKRAAQLLSISLGTVGNRLRSYWRSVEQEGGLT
ncbi:bacterial regulatory, Fis family protein [Ochrobactrum quorumnocens]|uniref:Bacterial regulatory, Fis family protein n=1 Tax=Ochrobactrum quorumnocens TaxID=271865 RepID=A0A248UBS9_9HYPH|nr:helix-turn-helix domain-containing protein [[Ochrobactrum] quorumnocens]ASV84185.1 bacterial regulatory, Fis family protein [[Ochrobactrum] quorumnocens]